MKNCPYCGKAMSSGHLFSPRSCAVYWLPTGVELESWIVSTKSVQERGGVVLGEALPFCDVTVRIKKRGQLVAMAQAALSS